MSECKSLYGWLVNQRTRKRFNQLPSEHGERLDNLGFPWEGDLSGVPYCPHESQSHEQHSTTDKHEQDDKGDDDNGEGNQQGQKTLLYGEIHPDVINRELEWLGIPTNQSNGEQTDDRNGASNSQERDRKRKTIGTRTRTEPQSTLNQPSTSHDCEFVNKEDEEEEEEKKNEKEAEEPPRKRLSTRTPQQSNNMVSNVARHPSQSNNTNDSDDNSIDDPSPQWQHEETQAAYPVANNDGIESGSQDKQMDEDKDDRKLPATTRTWDESYSSLVSHLKEHRQWPDTREGTQLAKWLSDQRRNKMMKKKCFTERRLFKLNRLGISWESGVPHKFVCPVESDIGYLRAWMSRFTVLKMYLEKHQRWPSVVSNLDLYEWVRRQQLLLVHDDTPDSVERIHIEEFDRVGIDWEDDMSDRAFSPSTSYQALNAQV